MEKGQRSKLTVKPSKSNDDIRGWCKQVTSATAQARADVDDINNDVSERDEARGSEWQRVRGAWRRMRENPDVQRRVGVRAVFDGVEAFTIV